MLEVNQALINFISHVGIKEPLTCWESQKEVTGSQTECQLYPSAYYDKTKDWNMPVRTIKLDKV